MINAEGGDLTESSGCELFHMTGWSGDGSQGDQLARDEFQFSLDLCIVLYPTLSIWREIWMHIWNVSISDFQYLEMSA